MNDEIKLEWGDTPANESLSTAVETEEKGDKLKLALLPEQEQAQVREFVKKINIADTNAVSSYGADVQNKIASFSDGVLKSVRTKDTGEAGKLLSNLVVEIKGFDASADDKPGLFGIFGGVRKQFDKLTANYAKIESNVEKISTALETHRRVLLKDVAMFDELYDNNYNYYKELTMYIIAGKEKLREVNEQVIPLLRAKAEETKDEADVQKLTDMLNSVSRFEKKIHDLMLSRMVSIQMAPQIRLIQSNDTQLVDKIQSSIANAIPLWKNQIVIALGIANAKSALESQKKVSQMTNDLLKKNSELLKQGSLEIAEESEKSLISIETIQKTNQDLIDTINGVIEIQNNGRIRRMEAEKQLGIMENEFKQALLSAGKNTK